MCALSERFEERDSIRSLVAVSAVRKTYSVQAGCPTSWYCQRNGKVRRLIRMKTIGLGTGLRVAHVARAFRAKVRRTKASEDRLVVSRRLTFCSLSRSRVQNWEKRFAGGGGRSSSRYFTPRYFYKRTPNWTERRITGSVENNEKSNEAQMHLIVPVGFVFSGHAAE